nr:nitroreductase [uncultured Dorea sp.]
MNESIKNMIERRSIHSFKPDAMVSKEDMDVIIEAGTYAATGMGMQSPIIIAVTNKETRDQLSKMNATIMRRDMDPFYGAPVVLIVLADKNRPTHIYDGSLVMGNLMNAAASLGIGSCWIHRAKEEFESEEGKALLKKWGIEGDYEGIGHCVLGYPDGDVPKAKPRKENYVYYVD